MDITTRKNIISTIITSLFILAGVLGFIYLKNQKKSTVSAAPPKKERRKVQMTSFQMINETNKIAIDGRLEAQERVNITSKVSGIMQAGGKNLKEGVYVNKGDLLFSIDKNESDLALKAQKSTLFAAISSIMPDLKFDHPESFDHWQSYLNSFDVERPIPSLPKPKSDSEKFLIAAKNIPTQYFNIKSVEDRLTNHNIYAPFSGVVTTVNIFPGTLISPGQVLASMINTSTYELQAPVPLDNLKYLSVGQKVMLKSEELGGEWAGTINRIGSQLDPNTQNIPIYISLKGNNLKDGLYLKGVIMGKVIENIYKLPKQLFLSPDEVFVVEDSTLVTKKIQPVKRTENHVLVKGLQDNDQVVSGSLAGLFEGQKVNY